MKLSPSNSHIFLNLNLNHLLQYIYFFSGETLHVNKRRLAGNGSSSRGSKPPEVRVLFSNYLSLSFLTAMSLFSSDYCYYYYHLLLLVSCVDDAGQNGFL